MSHKSELLHFLIISVFGVRGITGYMSFSLTKEITV